MVRKSGNNKKSAADSTLEVVIGIVSPLGVDHDKAIALLKKIFQDNGFIVEIINITKEFFDFSKCKNLPESLKYFAKMEMCSYVRKNVARGYFAGLAIKKIQDKRDEIKEKKKVIYIIDQLKNVAESDVLNFVYGQNYIQVSLFSTYEDRDVYLRNKFDSDELHDDGILEKEFKKVGIKDNLVKKEIKKKENKKKIIADWRSDVLADAAHKLLEKDFVENSEEFSGKGTGQQIAKLFHLSHYFFNVDFLNSKLENEVKKFVDILNGKYTEYPEQDEFGMALAYQASVRSNFPGGRQIGACIISKNGEVISVGSIRAPTSSSNTKKIDKDRIEKGYKEYKKFIEECKSYFKHVLNELDTNEQLLDSLNSLLNQTNNNEATDAKHLLNKLNEFINDSLDFHPCTHAEIAAIIDAAKMGVSVRGSTIYSTLFPCHLCAKEIITAGIKKVIYLEAYPKSRNKELYPNNINFNIESQSGKSGCSESDDTKIPFNIFVGVGPKRYHYVYSLKNKPRDETPNCNMNAKDQDQEGENDNVENNFPPLIKFERAKFYAAKENAVLECVKHRKNKTCDLCALVGKIKGNKGRFAKWFRKFCS